MSKKYTFHVHGMHCASCVVLTESELAEHPGVKCVKADLARCCVEVEGFFGNVSAETLAEELSGVLKKHGYVLSLEKERRPVRWSDFKYAAPCAAAFIVLFIVLQKSGIVNVVQTGDVSYGTAFLIGVIASLSTCMAVVGGLALSVSANFAKEGEKIRPQLFFHTGRLISFFVLGGVIGAAGAAFTLGMAGTFILNFLTGLVMLLLGINLLGLVGWTRRLQPVVPRVLSRHLLRVRTFNHTATPALLGVATFFLPCGFTQSMQIYTLGTGSFSAGALTMFVFALGTFPVLALLSFTSLGIHSVLKSDVFFKTAGLVVVFFALLNILTSFVAIGVLPPLVDF